MSRDFWRVGSLTGSSVSQWVSEVQMLGVSPMHRWVGSFSLGVLQSTGASGGAQTYSEGSFLGLQL